MLPKGYVFRLPTEAEWEYALNANGGKPGNPYIKWRDGDKSVEASIMVVWEDYEKILGEQASKVNKYFGIPSLRVGTKLPNDWGIYDMLSNGREFVLDTVEDTVSDKGNSGVECTGNLIYERVETDPLRFCLDAKTQAAIMRGGDNLRSPFVGTWFGKAMMRTAHKPGKSTTFRLVIGPDLLKERGIKLPDLGK